jgi:hypothetical protein
MTETTKDLLARLVGFTPGPHQVSGARAKQAPKLGEHARFLTIGPDDDAVALVFFDMKTGRGHMDAKLYAAAPDLHRIVTEQQAEIERLRAALSALMDLNDNHSPFGGEMYYDRIDRTWNNARKALEAAE